ncbi:MAG TPA: NAD(P)H-dependent oxidoreductase [Patescibacteria group bacterium]|nr:NAD(P)H-dependent oxidoreductase [Patescibacteria group bacterium]
MKNTRKKITIILGTAREGRQSIKPFEYLYELLSKKDDIEIKKIDVKDFNLNKTIAPWTQSKENEEFKAIVKNCEAFILVVPEYNHSFPGELKLLLDQALKEYKNKPVIVTGVSAGGFGGVRAVESLIPMLSAVGLKYIPHPLYFSNVEETFKLNKKELDDKYQDKINKSVDELLKAI